MTKRNQSLLRLVQMAILSAIIVIMGFTVLGSIPLGGPLVATIAQVPVDVYKRQALSQALEQSDLVVLTGGLGPTYDDMTKETVADYFGLPMEENKEALEQIKAFFAHIGRIMTENNKKQALIPKLSLIHIYFIIMAYPPCKQRPAFPVVFKSF